jgi:TatA/E family protein of Tat protein translocase
MPLLVFEFLGTTELMVIALVALIIFGPRKLPEIGRTIGKGMAEFKRASEDFKRTWEYEVEVERRQAEAPPEPEAGTARGQLPEGSEAVEPLPPEDWLGAADPEPAPEPPEQTIARAPTGADTAVPPEHRDDSPDEAPGPERERV